MPIDKFTRCPECKSKRDKIEIWTLLCDQCGHKTGNVEIEPSKSYYQLSIEGHNSRLRLITCSIGGGHTDYETMENKDLANKRFCSKECASEFLCDFFLEDNRCEK